MTKPDWWDVSVRLRDMMLDPDNKIYGFMWYAQGGHWNIMLCRIDTVTDGMKEGEFNYGS